MIGTIIIIALITILTFWLKWDEWFPKPPARITVGVAPTPVAPATTPTPTPATPPTPRIGFFGIIFRTLGVIALAIVVFGMGTCGYRVYRWATAPDTPRPAVYTPPSHIPQEALVLQHECLTPCSSFVGWSYKIRTDGDPLRIKYNGCDWFDQPARGQFQAPKCFQPGEAQFKSPEEKNPHVQVWVYQKIAVPIGR
jgi:hypothetical protein